MDFSRNLAMRYNALTKQSKRLADYIRENPAGAIKMTAKALGEAGGTSAAAVVRLCQQLGYDSLEQLKISLAQTLDKDELSAPIDPIIAQGDSVADIAQKLCRIQTDAVQETLALLDYDEIKKAVGLIQKARRVYLFGVGSSGLVAQEFSHRLNRIGKPCLFLQDGHTNLEYAALAEEKDLVIGLSYSGETKEVYLAAQYAKQKGAEVIAITRNRVSTLSACATQVLSVPETEKRVRVGAVTSITSQMFMVDVLYMALLQKDYSRYESLLLDTSHIANLLRE